MYKHMNYSADNAEIMSFDIFSAQHAGKKIQ